MGSHQRNVSGPELQSSHVTYEAAVEVGIFVFQSQERGSAEVRAALEQRGVAPWLAQRLAVYLPIAFGRRLFDGAVTMSNAILDGARELPLDGDPVWRATEERARRAVRGEVERIGLGSAEVAAVNQALHGGSRLEDLVLGPVALLEPLLPAENGHGGLPSPLEAFRALLDGHGFPVDESGRIGSLRIDARVFPRGAREQVSLQVDFIVAETRLSASYLIESFAGWGSTWRDAINQTIQKFERGSLHVFIAALLDRSSCGDQVTWERFEHPGGAFDACLGAQLTLYAESSELRLGPLLDAVYAALRDVELSRAIHGLRIYVGLIDGKLTTPEVLLDNETWSAGEALARSTKWPVVQGLVSARLFLLLVPVAAQLEC